MIQPISYSNTNFRGNVQVAIKNAPNKGIEEIKSKIPEEAEREAFETAFDGFTQRIAEATPEDASFLLELEYGDWHAGGVLKSGKSVTFEMKDLNDSGKRLFKGELPLIRRNGKLWQRDENNKKKDFTNDIEKFFSRASRTILNAFGFNEAVRRVHAPKNTKSSSFDKIS